MGIKEEYLLWQQRGIVILFPYLLCAWSCTVKVDGMNGHNITRGLPLPFFNGTVIKAYSIAKIGAYLFFVIIYSYSDINENN